VNVTLALPYGWRHNVSAVAALAALRQHATKHALVVLVPPDEFTEEDALRSGINVRAWRTEGELDLPTDVLVVPAGSGSELWARSCRGRVRFVPYLYDLTSGPTARRELFGTSDGVLVAEPSWANLMHRAAPGWPTLYLPPGQVPRDLCGTLAKHPSAPYLLTWAPASTASIAAIATAFEKLAKCIEDLHVVVVGRADEEAWRRELRPLGLWRRAILLPFVPSQVGQLMGSAHAVVAPSPSAGHSAALLFSEAREWALRLVELAPGEGSLVLEDGVPQVRVGNHHAGDTLYASLVALCGMDDGHAQALLARRRARQQQLLRERVGQFDAFLLAIAGAPPAKAFVRDAWAGRADDLRGYCVGVTTACIGELGLTTLDAQTSRSLAESLATLTRVASAASDRT